MAMLNILRPFGCTGLDPPHIQSRDRIWRLLDGIYINPKNLKCQQLALQEDNAQIVFKAYFLCDSWHMQVN